MQIPPQITQRNMNHSEALQRLIRDEVDRLERFYDRITTCRVAVEYPHRHHRRGQAAHVRIDIVVPGEELVITHEPSLHKDLRALEVERRIKSWETLPEYEYRDAYLAVRNAFHKARRVLEDYARRLRGEVKGSVEPPKARVVKLDENRGFGFLETSDGREIYFHRDSVLNGHFARLSIGSLVSFAEEEGEKGPQASTVRLSSK